MQAETRRVLIFMGIGLLAAAAIGFGVWRASTPSTLSPTDTAMTGTTSSTVSLSQAETRPNQVTEETNDEQQSLEVAPIETDDPYLAPHAHIPVPGQEPSATRIFRPSNPFETEEQSSFATEPTLLPEGTEPRPAITEPSEPVDPTQPIDPTQPTESTEPTEEPTVPTEPSPAPPASTEVTLTPQTPTPEATPELEEPAEPAAAQAPAETEEPTETEAPEETAAPEETERAGTPGWGSWFS